MLVHVVSPALACQLAVKPISIFGARKSERRRRSSIAASQSFAVKFMSARQSER